MDQVVEHTNEINQGDSTLVEYFNAGNIDGIKNFIREALDSKSFKYQELIHLAKDSPDAANLAKELVLHHQLDETELADRIAREIIGDIENYTEQHLEKFEKYTLSVPQLSGDTQKSKSKFFNLIGLLKDVSILARKLLEISPRLNTPTPTTPQTSSSSLSMDKKWPLNPGRRDTKSQVSEEDATSEDQLAALIESSSSDDFLVLSSSIESFTMRDMLKTALTLITSHECFTLSHDIQGVAMVLRRTKFIIKNILAPHNQMGLIIRLLTSIGRFNEMNYVFDLFRDRNQFEVLLSKGVEKTPELRIALFNYVKKNPEFYALVTLNFSMFREIAESLETSANKRLDKLISNRLTKNKMRGGGGGGIVSVERHKADADDKRDSSKGRLTTKSNSIGANLSSMFSSNEFGKPDNLDGREHQTGGRGGKPLYSKDSLDLCLIEMVDASECFAKAGCYKRSNNCEKKAKLIALQLALLRSETNVLGLQQSELNDTIVSFESFSNAYIVAEAYNHQLAWRQALFRNVVLGGRSFYLEDFCSAYDLSSTLVVELVLLFKHYITDSNNHLSHEQVTKLGAAMQTIIACRDDVELKCKLYTQLNLTEARNELLLDPSIKAHLRDLGLA